MIPRQRDLSSLVLEIFRRSGTRSDGDRVFTLPLGRNLISSGYDPWSDDMEDIEVEVSYSVNEIALTVNGWTMVYQGDYWI